MPIEQITLSHLKMRLKSPFKTSFGVEIDRECILITMHGDGITAYGECVAMHAPLYSSETIQTAWHILRDHLIPLTLGKDFAPAEYQAAVAHIRGHQMAKAGLEMAFYDWHGKREGLSLKHMLGGERETVPVGVSVGIQPDPAALVETIARYLADGYRRVKIKIEPGRDVTDAQAVRSAYPELALQVDANSAYTLETADALLPLDELGLLLIEQPLGEDDLWDHHKLQKKFRTPICLDESIHSPEHARHAIEMEATRVINIKPGRVGGLLPGKAIHDLCQAASIPVWCGGMLETGVGRAANLAMASLPNFTLPGDISASDRYYEEDVTLERFTLNPDSTITVPDAPGLGITIDPGALKRATQTEQTWKI